MKDDPYFKNWVERNYPPNVAEYILTSLEDIRKMVNEYANRKRKDLAGSKGL